MSQQLAGVLSLLVRHVTHAGAQIEDVVGEVLGTVFQVEDREPVGDVLLRLSRHTPCKRQSWAMASRRF